MASTKFYESTAQLQAVIRDCEAKRFQLDVDLKNCSNSSSDNKDLKIDQFQKQLKNLCENEKHSSERNKRLLQDIERVEDHLSNLSSRTDRLRKLKKQYNDYIDRVYPGWNEEASKLAKEKGMPVDSVTVEIRNKSTAQCHRVHSPGRHQSNTPSRCRSPSPAVRDSRKRTSGGASLPNSPERVPAELHSTEFSSPESKSHSLNKAPIVEDQVELSSEKSPHTSLESSPSLKITSKMNKVSPRRPECIDSLSLTESRSEFVSPSERIGQADLSLHGLYRLLDHFENDSKGRTVQNIYGYSPRDLSVVEEVIRDANSSGSLAHLNIVTVSSVILDQLMLINAGLPQGCLFSDSFIKELSELGLALTETAILSRMNEFKASLWKRLHEHFTFLINRGFMKIDELTEKFSACLIHSNSRLENEMVQLLKNFLSDISVMDSITEDSTSFASPQVSRDFLAAENPQLISSLGATAGSFYELNNTASSQNFDLKGSAAYKNLISSSRDKLDTDNQEIDSEEEQAKLDALIATESPSPLVTQTKDKTIGENKLRSTQELIKSVARRDSDLDDLSSYNDSPPQSTNKKKEVDYDDDFSDFFD